MTLRASVTSEMDAGSCGQFATVRVMYLGNGGRGGNRLPGSQKPGTLQSQMNAVPVTKRQIGILEEVIKMRAVSLAPINEDG